jgi:hypothetical protein
LDERLQFRRLLRDFSFRFLDNELLSAEGDSGQTMVHTLALLAALALSLSLCYVYRYSLGLSPRISAAVRDSITWGDKEFLISLAMMATGLAAIVAWDGLFPDRRDCLVLSALPVRNRTIFAAKLCAVVALFAAVTAALNVPTAICFPWLALPEDFSLAVYIRYVSAHTAAVLSASAFVFFTFVTIQALLINALSFRQYKWLSAWVQLGALFALVAGFFFIPDIARPASLADPRNRMAALALPPFWFLGLYEELLGVRMPIVQELAGIARAAVAGSAAVALSAYCLGYGRYLRKTVEEAEAIASNRTGPGAAVARLVDRILVRNPVERAVFHFAARTMSRNRKHRLLLAIYAGVGLSYVFHNIASLLAKHRTGGFDRLDTVISSVPMVLSFFILLGMRVLFTIPVELRANWVFRLTENGRPAEYLAGARKLMIAAGIAPLALATFPVYGMLWGWSHALRHLLLVVLILLLVLEYMMRGFPKIPFTCSFVPGKANLKARFGAYCVFFLLFGYLISLLEIWLVWKPRGYWIGVAAISLVLVYRAWRRNQWERKLGGFVYEERPDWVLAASLDLQT